MSIRTTLVTCLLALAGPVLAARADLVCPAPNVQAGQCKTGRALVHRFHLANHGSSVIDITQIKPACGCLRPHIDRVTYAPGEQGEVLVEINTVTQPAGPNSWKVTLQGNEAGKPFELGLVVQATLVAEVAISPATLILHTQTALTHDFTLTEHRERPLEVRSAVTGSPHLRARVAPAARQGAIWTRRITLEVLSSCPEGRHEEVLHVYTSDPEYPELKVAFTVVKQSPGQVQASPTSAEWLVPANQPLPARIVLLSAGDEPIEIERIETSHPCLRCTWAAGPGPRATLRIQLERENTAASFDGSIKLHLKKPTSQIVTVPVRCRLP
jgi:hypothetical protein